MYKGLSTEPLYSNLPEYPDRARERNIDSVPLYIRLLKDAGRRYRQRMERIDGLKTCAGCERQRRFSGRSLQDPAYRTRALSVAPKQSAVHDKKRIFQQLLWESYYRCALMIAFRWKEGTALFPNVSSPVHLTISAADESGKYLPKGHFRQSFGARHTCRHHRVQSCRALPRQWAWILWPLFLL